MIWIAAFLVSLAFLWLWISNKNAKKLPPGPIGLPILGSLHKLGANPHRGLHQLAQKYGPIMHLRLGFVPTIVISSPQAAELFLKTHDLVFASRPPHEAIKYIAWEQRNLGFAEYGSYWRNMRKMCTLELLSQTKINSFRIVREEELDLSIKLLREASNDGAAAVDISAKVARISADVACRMVLGKKYMDQDLDEKGFKAVVQEDMLLGSMDTSATVIEWTLSELLKNPRVMKKVQMELETVVGMQRKVKESDLDKLEYLDMVIKENMRLHPVAPLLIPHQSREDCMVGDFFIPRKSRVVINAWAIMRDSSVWSEAEKFWPERFEGSNIDVRGHDFQFIPFGSGRRACPGMQMGLTMVRLTVAQLVHCFHWKLPSDMLPDHLDMTEEFGLTMPRANHLLAVPTYRLHTASD
ncbi:hypothetical protein GLYMA_08G140600v4 [Glycine max]|uniref:cytochrome P450 71AU50 isoform X2 n=1 Tax=Glycine max TaxID=3847 RepID=UPI0003DE9CBD|nr:cytochrome P450 71AU50 isoform X2 [Glycine max]KAG4398929.1 hypothetical protein GLYMA_08G140600v4 [Glycine max]|eukprot:XP_006585306.1 cytochrome P450 CYP736A12 isoform X2 [Glycine max]